VGDLGGGGSSAAETWNLAMVMVVVEGVSSFVVSRTLGGTDRERCSYRTLCLMPVRSS
jgi:hypothetical protein